MLELSVIKLFNDPQFYQLDLLALVLNPANKFHTYNANRSPETVFPEDFEPYAR